MNESGSDAAGGRHVLVTGATGYIGGRLVKQLRDRGVPIRCGVRDLGRRSDVVRRAAPRTLPVDDAKSCGSGDRGRPAIERFRRWRTGLLTRPSRTDLVREAHMCSDPATKAAWFFFPAAPLSRRPVRFSAQ